MPTRIYNEDNIKKRKSMFSGDEKPTRKYTKAIKEEKEIKKEPLDDLSDGNIDDDDVMDIEEADGTMPNKKGKLNAKGQKRVVKTKRVKKLKPTTVTEKDKDGKDIKPKPKRKRKPQTPTTPVPAANNDSTTTVNPTITTTTAAATTTKPSAPVEPSKTPNTNNKKVPKIKEKKEVKQKMPRSVKKDESKAIHDDSETSDSSPEESDAYETCGVANCTRPSGGFNVFALC